MLFFCLQYKVTNPENKKTTTKSNSVVVLFFI
jgi:hypothetical protein